MIGLGIFAKTFSRPRLEGVFDSYSSMGWVAISTRPTSSVRATDAVSSPHTGLLGAWRNQASPHQGPCGDRVAYTTLTCPMPIAVL